MGRNIERLKIMLVSLPPNFNQSKKINSLKFSQRTNYIIPMKKDSVSFGDGGMSLIYLVAKYGAVEGLKNGIKHNSYINFKRACWSILIKPNSHINELVDVLFALSKTPQNMEKESVSSRIVAALRGGDWNDLISLKNSAINAVPHISDDIPANREAKKALMLSCLDGFFF